MSDDRHDATTDAALERRLLDSAALDTVPPSAEVGRAWTRFAATIGGAALDAGSSLDALTVARASRRAAAKWLAIGAIGGGAIATAVLWPGAPSPKPAGVSPAGTVEPRLTTPRPAEPPAPTALEPAPAPLRARTARADAANLQRRLGVTPPQAMATSRLKMEVAALDRVRSALADGEPARARTLLSAYRRTFPEGQLAADADALAIQALSASGRQEEANRRAERFLKERPSDPLAERVGATVR